MQRLARDETGPIATEKRYRSRYFFRLSKPFQWRRRKKFVPSGSQEWLNHRCVNEARRHCIDTNAGSELKREAARE